ncbi:hypothetical protein [Nocardia sp. 852002-51244_SCH5132740]|uniref:hypothetical protein n=1 Tax=Nocardia sp. 852002-51244_SCH5132740 TaxID=1834099 RepID=UPI0018D3A5FC|nr:hypothetical protein [Nocardia sp. 852002-51244_SCH5132740]
MQSTPTCDRNSFPRTKTGNTTTNPSRTSIYHGGSRRRRFDRTGIGVERPTDAVQCAIGRSNTVVTAGRRYESPELAGEDIAALGGTDIAARQQDRHRLTERVVERRRRVDIAESEVPTALSVRHPAGAVVTYPGRRTIGPIGASLPTLSETPK